MNSPKEKPPRTEIAALGEFGLIDKIKEHTHLTREETLLGIGDDAAVIKIDDTHCLVVTTDMLLEGVHFDLAYCPLQHLGYKALTVNLSDVAAMNAVPQQVTVGIALSNRFSVEAVEAIYQGINLACQQYGVDLVGGDTTSSRSGLVISVTALGRGLKQRLTYRSGAKNGDILCVTGDLGAAYVGLQVLEREKQVYLENPEMQPLLEGKDYPVRRQLKPEARTDIVHELAALDIVPTSMIDISDGLASEVLHLCKQSQLGAVLYEDKIPIAEITQQICYEDFKISATTAAMNGGEDYELLFTIKQEDYDKIKKMADVSLIGYMQSAEKGTQLFTRSGQSVSIQAQGWQHF